MPPRAGAVMLRPVQDDVPDTRPLSGQPARLLSLGAAVVVCATAFGGAVGLVPVSERPRDGSAVREAAAPRVASEPVPPTAFPHLGPAIGLLSAGPARTVPAADRRPDRVGGTALPADSGDGRRVVFSESRQRVWLVDGREKVVRTYLVSGSIHDNLDPGHYAVYSKSRHAVAYDYRETMNYMVRFTSGENAAIGFHDLPELKNGRLAQTRQELGTPQSSGCVRQWKPDARALWKFTDVGTSVDVVA